VQHPVGPGTAIGWPPRAEERRPKIIAAACGTLGQPLTRPAARVWLAALLAPQIRPAAAGHIWGAAAGACAVRAGLAAAWTGALGCAGPAAFRAGVAAARAGFPAILIRHAAIRSR
jgi:hypothetical protein